MAESHASEPVDALALRGRVRTLQIGAWPSAFTCLFFAAYHAWTWEQPHRSALLVISAVTLVASVVLARVPIEPLVRGRWREPFFLTWSASIVGLVTAAAALDGGVTSPLALAFFLPLVYSALSYPLASMLAVAAIDLAAFVGLAVLGGPVDGPYAFVFASSLVAAAWICAWQARNADAQRRSLARVSRTDPLTGALNRLGFEERLAADLAEAERHGRPAALVLLDLDTFKRVNDTRGHAAGDQLLCWVVDTLREHLRARDSIGRLGGDEFAIVLDQDRASARASVDRLRDVLAQRTGVSAGIAVFGRDGHDAEALHHAADLELYAHKNGAQAEPAAWELAWATALARCVDERMALGHEHSRAVADLAAAIATRLEWSAPEIGDLRLAAILHDVGKISVPVAILRKRGPLTPEEMAVVARHPADGADVVARVAGLATVARWIRHSHERLDGTGYPGRLAGDEIPLASRILFVADAYDAMTSDRPYQDALPATQALEELRANAGTQFDPACVAALETHLGELAATAPGPAAVAAAPA